MEPVFKKAHHYPHPKPDQSSSGPHPIFLRFNLILASYLCLCLPKCLFPYQIPVRTSPVPHTCHAHLIILDLINRIIPGEGYWVLKTFVIYGGYLLKPEDGWRWIIEEWNFVTALKGNTVGGGVKRGWLWLANHVARMVKITNVYRNS